MTLSLPEPVRRCLVCERIEVRWSSGVYGVVSPTGIEHIGRDDGVTACGKDATGDNWWWPL